MYKIKDFTLIKVILKIFDLIKILIKYVIIKLSKNNKNYKNKEEINFKSFITKTIKM